MATRSSAGWRVIVLRMSFADDLRTGACGVRLSLPPGLDWEKSDDDSCTAHDQERRLGWLCIGADVQLDLRPRHHDRLVRDVERHTRDLFVTFAAQQGNEGPLRTDDPTWSPLIDLSPRTLPGGPALVVIHRISYWMGSESILGHLLIPTRRGLFELRVTAPTLDATGLRETLLMSPLLAASGRPADFTPPQQAFFDDPAHDAKFPAHPLSRVRAALAWMLQKSDLAVTAPVATSDADEVVVEKIGHALVPPPRYVRVDPPEATRAAFTLATFAATEGFQWLIAKRQARGVPLGDAQTLHALAAAARASLGEGGPCETNMVGPDQLRLYTLRGSETGPRHNLYCWTRRAGGDIIMLGITAPQVTPRAEIEEQITDVARSLRPLAGPGKGRAWWQFWRA